MDCCVADVVEVNEEQTSDRIVTSGRVVGVERSDVVVVGKQKEQSGDDCVVVDDVTADNTDHGVVDILTDSMVKEEFDRVVEG